MKTSESIANIAAALVGFQSEVANPEKKGINPHFKSKYAELDDIINTIRPTLEKHGLAFIQNPVQADGQVGVYTVLIHKSGEYIQFDPVMIPLQKATPHQVGAALTYAKRYSLGAALGLATEEDTDGNEINNHNNQSSKNKQAQQPTKKQATAKAKDKTEERRKQGIEAIKELKEKIGLTDKEFESLLFRETLFEDINKLDFDQVKNLYLFLTKNEPDEIKEVARAYMEQQKAAGVA